MNTGKNGKSIGNIGLPVGITDKLTLKPVYRWTQKSFLN
jgi:hypothetical protein